MNPLGPYPPCPPLPLSSTAERDYCLARYQGCIQAATAAVRAAQIARDKIPEDVREIMMSPLRAIEQELGTDFVGSEETPPAPLPGEVSYCVYPEERP